MLKVEKLKENQKTNNKKVQRRNKGITLIALVITIIVILILAGVSINTLFGDNGLLTKADEARTANARAGAYDKVAVEVLASYDNNGTLNAETLRSNLVARKGEVEEGTGFPVKVKMDRYPFTIDSEGNVGDLVEVGGVEIPAGYTPLNKNAKKEEGIVIIDNSNNEYVWIPVPKEIYTDEKYNNTENDTITVNDTADIETVLRNYSKDYNARDSGGDVWYTWVDTNEDGKYNFNSEFYAETKEKNNSNLTTEIKESKAGCGLTYDEYYELKEKMLKSIYQNGGFWIGRYEAGIEGKLKSEVTGEEVVATPRRSHQTITSSSPKAVSKPNKYPYNCVTCSEAQELASSMPTSGGLTSSLMFGVQWNLVCKFLATSLGDTAVKSNSGTWGNYKDVEVTLDRGEYTTDPFSSTPWKTFDNSGDMAHVNNKEKQSNVCALLTTGASERNCKLNIYDFAGNELEWTLEKAAGTISPCSSRGGTFVFDCTEIPATYQYTASPTYIFDGYISFRVTLY